MSEEKKLEIAKEYVDRQLEVMQKHDSQRPELSEEEYRSLIADAAELVQA